MADYLVLIPFAVPIAYMAYCIWIRPWLPGTMESRVDRRVRLAFSFILCFYSLAAITFVGKEYVMFSVGMALSFLGDTALAGLFPRIGSGNRRLLVGGSLFALAQASYITAFWTAGEIAHDPGVRTWLWIWLTMLIGSYVLVVSALKPQGGLKKGTPWVPSMVYAALIMTMSASAMSAALGTGGYWWICALGSLLFIISDALVGSHEFDGRLKPREPDQAIWITYLLAQGFILGGAALQLVGK